MVVINTLKELTLYITLAPVNANEDVTCNTLTAPNTLKELTLHVMLAPVNEARWYRCKPI